MSLYTYNIQMPPKGDQEFFIELIFSLRLWISYIRVAKAYVKKAMRLDAGDTRYFGKSGSDVAQRWDTTDPMAQQRIINTIDLMSQ